MQGAEADSKAASLMLFHEPMIHLKGKDKLTCPVVISQDDLDGLYALTTWLEGYIANDPGGAGVPGQYELLMLYRRLRAASISQSKKNG